MVVRYFLLGYLFLILFVLSYFLSEAECHDGGRLGTPLVMHYRLLNIICCELCCVAP